MGKSGGRPKKETIGFNSKKTIGFEKLESKPKPNVNENVNVNDNENVNVNDNENVASDSCGDGLQKVIDFYSNNIGMLTPYGIEVLSDYQKEMDFDVIIYAMKLAVEADKRTMNYIKAILNNWSKKNIKTLVDAQKENQGFRKEERDINRLEDF